MLTRWCTSLLVLAACGKVVTDRPDGPAGEDAPPIDAPIDDTAPPLGALA